MNYKPMRSEPHMISGLECLIKLLPEGITGIEIGSYAGESSEIFAKSGKFKSLFCVDPWDLHYYSGNQMIGAEDRFDRIRSHYECVIVKMKGKSDDVLRKWNGQGPPLDFIYIDGNHHYVNVKNDIKNSLALLKRPGILAGHDYGFSKAPGVKNAVDKFLGYPDAVFCDTSWIKFIQ